MSSKKNYLKMKLEDRIDMGLFGFGNKSKGIAEHFDEHMDARGGVEDPSRREFLKKSMAVGAAAMAPGLLVPQTAKAYSDKLPPGFQPHLLNDSGLRGIMAWMMRLTNHPNNDVGKLTVRNILTRKGWYSGHDSINVETPTTQPAYWFAIAYFNHVYNGDIRQGFIFNNDLPVPFERLKGQNLPLYYFGEGIYSYFATWVSSNVIRSNSRNVEENLLKSIFTAAGKNEREVDEYLKYGEDLNLKTRKLQDVMRNLERRPYNNQLVAAWSSFLLTVNYRNVERNNNSEISGSYAQIMNQNIEVPIRKYVPRIRGPPNYNI